MLRINTMVDFNCPYCGEDLGHPDDCKETDQTYDWTCDKCNKKFVFTLNYSVDFTTSKADCLNGGEHNYTKIVGYPTEYFENKRRCIMCDKEILVSKEVK